MLYNSTCAAEVSGSQANVGKAHRTLKIKQRIQKETRNDFEKNSKNYSEMYTQNISGNSRIRQVFGMSD